MAAVLLLLDGEGVAAVATHGDHELDDDDIEGDENRVSLQKKS